MADPFAGYPPAEVELLGAAKRRHDEVCNCSPKYLMSCPRMAQAILDCPADEARAWRKAGRNG